MGAVGLVGGAFGGRARSWVRVGATAFVDVGICEMLGLRVRLDGLEGRRRGGFEIGLLAIGGVGWGFLKTVCGARGTEIVDEEVVLLGLAERSAVGEGTGEGTVMAEGEGLLVGDPAGIVTAAAVAAGPAWDGTPIASV